MYNFGDVYQTFIPAIIYLTNSFRRISFCDNHLHNRGSLQVRYRICNGKLCTKGRMQAFFLVEHWFSWKSCKTSYEKSCLTVCLLLPVVHFLLKIVLDSTPASSRGTFSIFYNIYFKNESKVEKHENSVRRQGQSFLGLCHGCQSFFFPVTRVCFPFYFPGQKLWLSSR